MGSLRRLTGGREDGPRAPAVREGSPPFKPLQNLYFFADKISNVDSRAMISALGKDIPAQEAADLLLKLMLERTIVQAVFASSSSSTAALIGVVYPAPGGTAVVKPARETQQPVLRFDPSAATSFKLGDGYVLPEGAFRGHRVTSALCFCYPDKTQVALLELHRLDSEEPQELETRREAALNGLRKLSRPLPPGFTFDRLDGNER
jgi:hypothetical protein